jgi:hypothetical protein
MPFANRRSSVTSNLRWRPSRNPCVPLPTSIGVTKSWLALDADTSELENTNFCAAPSSPRSPARSRAILRRGPCSPNRPSLHTSVAQSGTFQSIVRRH